MKLFVKYKLGNFSRTYRFGSVYCDCEATKSMSDNQAEANGHAYTGQPTFLFTNAGLGPNQNVISYCLSTRRRPLFVESRLDLSSFNSLSLSSLW